MTTYILIGAAAGLVVTLLWLRERRRSTALRGMALRRGFVYLGKAIPKSLTLYGTPMDQADSVWNVIDGECNRIRVVAFDCRMGSGKGSWRRTVIAARSLEDPFSGAISTPNLMIDYARDWAILYQPKTISLISPGLMPVEQIEAHF